MSNFFKQWDAATAAAEARMKKLRELAVKHNVTLSTLIHDELIVEGDPKNVKAFEDEYLADVKR